MTPTLERAAAARTAWKRLLAAGERMVTAHTRALLTGQTTPTGFANALTDTLSRLHAQAAAVGRHHAGALNPPDKEDGGMAASVMAGEAVYLQKFAAALSGDRYRDEAGNWQTARIRQRARWYLGRIYGTANEAFCLASVGPLIWRLGEDVEDHCGDCPRLAAGSPYTRETLPTVPRRNDTACLFACSCFIQRSDGLTTFK
jgi:hypothetical protein